MQMYVVSDLTILWCPCWALWKDVHLRLNRIFRDSLAGGMAKQKLVLCKAPVVLVLALFIDRRGVAAGSPLLVADRIDFLLCNALQSV
jgi:hypothetical protein